MSTPSSLISLDSPRWKAFKTYFGSSQDLPRRIAAWMASIGGPDEERKWDELWEQFLHQGTITEAAYAVVPYVARELAHVAPHDRLMYFVQLGLIESARQSSAPEIPDDLAASYHAAVAELGRVSVESLLGTWDKPDFRFLLGAVSSLCGHGALGNILFKLDALGGQCPNCGKWVYPDGVEESGYAE